LGVSVKRHLAPRHKAAAVASLILSMRASDLERAMWRSEAKGKRKMHRKPFLAVVLPQTVTHGGNDPAEALSSVPLFAKDYGCSPAQDGERIHSSSLERRN
jgi:hypothetical protein